LIYDEIFIRPRAQNSFSFFAPRNANELLIFLMQPPVSPKEKEKSSRGRDQRKGTRPIFTFVPAKFLVLGGSFFRRDDSFNKKELVYLPGAELLPKAVSELCVEIDATNSFSFAVSIFNLGLSATRT